MPNDDPVVNRAMSLLHQVRRMRARAWFQCDAFLAASIIAYSRLMDKDRVEHLDLGWGDA